MEHREERRTPNPNPDKSGAQCDTMLTRAARTPEQAATLAQSIAGGALLFIVFVAYPLAQSQFAVTPEPVAKIEKRDKQMTALGLAQQNIKERLRLPDTANFGALQESVITRIGDDLYRIKSHVDAQSTLGGRVRMNWLATVQLHGNDTGRVKIDSIEPHK